MYLEWMNEGIAHETSFHQNGLKELPSLIGERATAEIYMQTTETTALTTTSHPQKYGNAMLMMSFLLYENPTYMTSFNISTAFTPRQSLPWKLNRTPKFHSWTHSSRGIVTTTFPSESTGNLHTQTNTLNSHLNIQPEQRKAHHVTIRQIKEPFRPRKRRKSSHSSTSD